MTCGLHKWQIGTSCLVRFWYGKLDLGEHSTLVVIAAIWDVLLETDPGDPGDPGEPGDPGDPGKLLADDWLVRLAFVPLEKESLKLGLWRPERFVFRRTSFSSLSLTGISNKVLLWKCNRLRTHEGQLQIYHTSIIAKCLTVTFYNCFSKNQDTGFWCLISCAAHDMPVQMLHAQKWYKKTNLEL